MGIHVCTANKSLFCTRVNSNLFLYKSSSAIQTLQSVNQDCARCLLHSTFLLPLVTVPAPLPSNHVVHRIRVNIVFLSHPAICRDLDYALRRIWISIIMSIVSRPITSICANPPKPCPFLVRMPYQVTSCPNLSSTSNRCVFADD